MSEWWQGVEAALAEHSAEAPDPWAEQADELPMLTDQQRAFLEQIAAQPQPTRLSLDDEPDDADRDDGPDDDGPESATWRVGRRPG